MPKKPAEIVHPLAAMEALQGFYQDVTLLVMAAHNAADMLGSKTLSPQAVAKAVAPDLEKAVAGVRKWMDGP